MRHSEALEQGSYRGKSADFLFLYIFGGSMLLVSIFSMFFLLLFIFAMLIFSAHWLGDLLKNIKSTILWP